MEAGLPHKNIYDKYSAMDALSEDLKRWFKEKWVDISRKDKSGKHPPCGRAKASGKKYPKCRPSVRVSSETPETSGEMSDKEKKSAVRQKRTAEKTKKRKGKKPIMTSHHDIKEEVLLEKNKPTNPGLYSRVKAQAKQKFDVYPSAYANAWLVKEYKKRGGGFKSVSEERLNTIDQAIENLFEAASKKDMPCNKPRASTSAGKKMMVKACEGGKEKIVHFGAKGYGHNYSAAARKSFKARHKCSEKKSKLSAQYWACKKLWAGKGGSKSSCPPGRKCKY
jgi:hypothetical protein